MTAIAIPQLAGRKERFWWHGRAASWMRGILQRAVLPPLVRVLCTSLRIDGASRLAALEGPAIYVANHSSHFDAVLVLRALPAALRGRVTVAAAKDYFYSNTFKGAFTSLTLNTYPFDRDAHTVESLADTAALIRGGWSVLIFPEGTRSMDGRMGRFKRGAGRLAADTGVPVVPIAIDGAHELMAKGRCTPRRGRVRVTFGEAAIYACTESATEIANDLHDRVAALRERA